MRVGESVRFDPTRPSSHELSPRQHLAVALAARASFGDCGMQGASGGVLKLVRRRRALIARAKSDRRLDRSHLAKARAIGVQLLSNAGWHSARHIGLQAWHRLSMASWWPTR